MARRAALVVAGLTVAALALRLPLMGDALFGDEVFTHDLVERDSLRKALGHARNTEGTPPLFYVLAWASHWIGDPTWSIRLPSLVFGVATIPVAYLLGVRVAGTAAGILAAALVALSPFHVYYSTEARAYAVAIFFVALALLAVVSARAGGRRWWVVAAVATAGAMYSHYTAAFPVAAVLAWSFFARPDTRRQLLAVVGAAVVAYLPWLPFVSSRGAQEAVAAVSEFTPESVGSDLVRVVAGHPYRPVGDLPGEAWLFVLALGLVAAGALCWRASSGAAALWRAAQEPVGAVVLAAVATPVGIDLYSLAGDDIFLARNISVSLVPACAAIAALVAGGARAAPHPAVGALVVAAVVAPVGAATIQAYGDDSRRVAWDRAAESVKASTERGDPVVNVVLIPLEDFLGRDPQLRSLEINLDEPRVVREARHTPASILAAARGARRVAVVIPGLPEFPPVPAPRLAGYRLVRQVVHPGLAPVSVFAFERVP